MSLEAGELVQLLNQSPSLRPALLRYVHVFVKQTAQTALLSARGNLTHRLVRWLLMAHDRIGSEELRLTQDCLAMILRVQRASANIVLRHLQSRGLISTTRKSIVIENRRGLEEAAGGFYDVTETADAGLLILSARRDASCRPYASVSADLRFTCRPPRPFEVNIREPNAPAQFGKLQEGLMQHRESFTGQPFCAPASNGVDAILRIVGHVHDATLPTRKPELSLGSSVVAISVVPSPIVEQNGRTTVRVHVRWE